jgi:hypothetical protein
VREQSVQSGRPGFLLLEILVGVSVFALFVGAVGTTLLYGQESTIMSGDRIRAVQHTETAIEASRAMRDASFAALTTGQHGVGIDGITKKWAYTGSQITASGGYVTSITVSPVTTDWVKLSGLTKWKRGYARSGAVLITSELTDWRSTKTIGNWSSISVEGSYTDAGTPTFTDVDVYSGSYVFASASAGNGLYGFDIRTPSSPSLISSSFSLGVGAYDVAVHGSILYVATDDTNQEIRMYSLATPVSLSAANLINTYNLPGSARARSLAVAGDRLYVGATATVGQDEFYAFRVTQTGGIALMDTINDDSSTYEMIAVSGTAAYLASSMTTSELRVINVESGSNLILMGGYNLTDRSVSGLSIAVSGTSALLGTAKGTFSETVLFDVRNGGVPTTPGPWYHESRDPVTGLGMDPTRCYGFIATQSGSRAFQVFNVRNKNTLAELTTYNSTTGLGRGLMYDPYKDRVYMITDRSLLIFRPGAATGTCP